jgi:hypothetical protein
MKKLLILTTLPLMVISGLAVVALFSVIKAIEEAHDDQYFWE